MSQETTFLIAVLLVGVALAGCVGQSGSSGDAPSSDDGANATGPSEPAEGDAASAGNGSQADEGSDEPRTWTTNETQAGNLPAATPTSPCRGAGNLWAERVEGVNYNNHTVAVNASVYSVAVELTWSEAAQNHPDLDMCLFGPNGSVMAESRTGDVGESLRYNLSDDDPTGDWTVEVYNYAGVDVDYQLTTTLYHRATAEGETAGGDSGY